MHAALGTRTLYVVTRPERAFGVERITNDHLGAAVASELKLRLGRLEVWLGRRSRSARPLVQFES